MNVQETLAEALKAWRAAEIAEATHFLSTGEKMPDARSSALLNLIRVVVDYTTGTSGIKNEKELGKYVTRYCKRHSLYG